MPTQETNPLLTAVDRLSQVHARMAVIEQLALEGFANELKGLDYGMMLLTRDIRAEISEIKELVDAGRGEVAP